MSKFNTIEDYVSFKNSIIFNISSDKTTSVIYKVKEFIDTFDLEHCSYCTTPRSIEDTLKFYANNDYDISPLSENKAKTLTQPKADQFIDRMRRKFWFPFVYLDININNLRYGLSSNNLPLDHREAMNRELDKAYDILENDKYSLSKFTHKSFVGKYVQFKFIPTFYEFLKFFIEADEDRRKHRQNIVIYYTKDCEMIYGSIYNFDDPKKNTVFVFIEPSSNKHRIISSFGAFHFNKIIDNCIVTDRAGTKGTMSSLIYDMIKISIERYADKSISKSIRIAESYSRNRLCLYKYLFTDTPFVEKIITHKLFIMVIMMDRVYFWTKDDPVLNISELHEIYKSIDKAFNEAYNK